jgi:hypothetical protein
MPARIGPARVIPAVLAAVLLGGCTMGSSPDELPPPPAPDQVGQPTPDPEHAPVLAAYEGYVAASNVAANLGDPDYPDLRLYADAGALADARAAIRQHADNGRVYTGARVVVSAEVSQFDPDAPYPEPAATVTACLDISDYLLVEKGTMAPLPVERDLEQVMATATLWYIPDQRWVVIETDAQWDTPC